MVMVSNVSRSSDNSIMSGKCVATQCLYKLYYDALIERIVN
jgi:hypothetical protein